MAGACLIAQQACPNFPHLQGSAPVSTWAEASFELPSQVLQEADCLDLAHRLHTWCDSDLENHTAALFTPTGAVELYPPWGCAVAQSTCRNPPGEAGSHAFEGLFFDNHDGAQFEEDRCLGRALDFQRWCNNSAGEPTVALFGPSGRVVVSERGPGQPEFYVREHPTSGANANRRLSCPAYGEAYMKLGFEYEACRGSSSPRGCGGDAGRRMAQECYRRAAAANPLEAAAHYNLGVLAYEDQRLEEALGHFLMAATIGPAGGRALAAVAEIYRIWGQYSEAYTLIAPLAAAAVAEAMATATATAPAPSPAGGFEQGAPWVGSRLPTLPGLEGWTAEGESRGVSAGRRVYGTMEDAHAVLLAWAKLAPRFGERERAIRGLRALVGRPAPPPPVSGGGGGDDEEAWASPPSRHTMDVFTRILVHFQLGLHLVEAGRDAEGFEHYCEGNRIKLESLSHDDFEETMEGMRALRRVLTRERLERIVPVPAPWPPPPPPNVTGGGDMGRGQGGGGERRPVPTALTPVFIVGVPRSGTSLLEQVLQMHPRIHAGGEAPSLGDFLPEMRLFREGGVQKVSFASELTQERAADIAARFLEELAVGAPPGTTHVTSKLPGHFQVLGIISRLFPSHAVLLCERSPLDAGLSNFFQHYYDGHHFSLALERIAAYYREFRSVIRFWQQDVGVAMTAVYYEDLVDGMEATTKQVLSVLGLDWDDRCLHFHRAERTVMTSSNEQVRQSLYRSSVGRWKRFKAELEGFQQALCGPRGHGGRAQGGGGGGGEGTPWLPSRYEEECATGLDGGS